MPIRLLNLLALLFLSVAAAVAALWVRSYFVSGWAHALEYSPAPGEQWRLVSRRGEFWLEHFRRPDPVVVQNLAYRSEQLSESESRLREWLRQNRERVDRHLARQEADESVGEAIRTFARTNVELRAVQRQLQDVYRQARSPRLRTRHFPYSLPVGALLLLAAASAAPGLLPAAAVVRGSAAASVPTAVTTCAPR